jgi:hypothetical protein
VTRYLITCQSNPDAPWPTDPKEYKQFMEQVWAGFDDFIEKGIIKEIGFFLDGGWDGFVIVEGESVDILKGNAGFFPYWLTETREIVSLEKVKEISRELMHSQIETTE